MKIALVYNPIAGRGRAAQVAGQIVSGLRAAGADVEPVESRRAGHIETLAREKGAQVDRVLVLGGDGSLREAAMGLLALPAAGRPELGILPFGTGNVVAREVGLPLNPLSAAMALGTAGARDWDVGYASLDGGDEQPFLAMAGLGYDAGVAAGIAAARDTERGSRWYRRSADALYVAHGMRGLFAWNQARFRTLVDGADLGRRGVAAVVSNVRTYAKGMNLSPAADPGDGLLDLHLRSNATPVAGGLALLYAQFRASPPAWVAASSLGTRFEFEGVGPEGVPVQLDGDALGTAKHVALRIETGQLRIAAP